MVPGGRLSSGESRSRHTIQALPRRRSKPMTDFQAIADRVEIEALRGE
jgi:hypothetical protein